MQRIQKVCFFLLCLISVSFSTFEDFKAQLQAKVQKIATAMENAYASRCMDQSIRECSVKSFDSCSGSDQRTCLNTFPIPTSCSGTSYLSEKSVIKMPNAFSAQNPSDQVKQFICTSAQTSVEQQLMTILQQNMQSYSYSYFGSNTGVLRVSPGFRYDHLSENQCVDYDPRLRPWYVNEAYNRKNLIVLAESSSIMGLSSGTALNSVKNALKGIVNTLDFDDTINIIKYSDTAESILSLSTVLRVTETGTERATVLAAIDSLSAGASADVNYQAALELGLDTIEASITGGQADCDEFIIVMVGSSAPTTGQTTFANLKTTVDNKVTAIGGTMSLSLFGMDVATAGTLQVMKDLACEYQGTYTQLGDVAYVSEFLTKADSYFQFLAFGNQNSNAVWSSIYEDAFGFGQLVTVSYPAYYNDGTQNRFLGVAGIDVLVSQFQTYEPNTTEISNRLATTKQCFNRVISDCEIQNIRGAQTCSTVSCTGLTDGSCSTSILTNDIYATPVDTTFTKCCDANDSVTTTYSSFGEFKAAMESKVKRLADKFSEVYPNRCGDRTCSTSTYNMCVGTPGRSCMSQFPTPDTCLATGYWSQQSVLRVPNYVSTDNMDEALKDFVCTSAQSNVENHLKATHEFDTGTAVPHSFSFFGSTTGAIRLTPGFKYDQTTAETCVDYDPRLRPWYVDEAFRKKNVVILVENSVMMSYDASLRLNSAKTAVKAILNTLESGDFASVISYSNESRSIVNKNYLERITSDGSERSDLLAAVEGLIQSQSTEVNYQIALQLAMDFIGSTIGGAGGETPDCNEYIVFMIGANAPTAGSSTSALLQTAIDNKKTAIGGTWNITLMGSNIATTEAELTILKELSCNYQGLYFNTPNVQQQSEFLTAISDFFQYLAFGNQNTEPLWSSIYEDAFGLGQLTTVAYPAYYNDGTQMRLIGVAGIDVLVEELQRYVANTSEVERLLSTEKQCFVRTIEGCQIENIRGSNTCGTSGCTLTDGTCSSAIAANATIFVPTASIEDSSTERCCDSLGVDSDQNVEIILLAVLFPVGVLLVLGALLLWLYKSKHPDNSVGNSHASGFGETGQNGANLIPESSFAEGARHEGSKVKLGQLKGTSKYQQKQVESQEVALNENENSQAEIKPNDQ